METTKSKRNGTSKTVPDGWHNWPTAIGVAKRLRCTRQHVYRLEQNGSISGHDGYSAGRLVRRFDPSTVDELVPSAEELGSDGLDEELELDEGTGAASEVLAVRLVTEARQAALEARKGQHEAYALVARPSQELLNISLEALKLSMSRTRELEHQLNKLYDEQRDARREDREFALVEKEVAAADARKDQFFRVAIDTAPMIFGQILESLRQPAGPLAAWLKSKTPEQQAKLISAIEAVMSVEDEAAGSSPPAPSSSPGPLEGSA